VDDESINVVVSSKHALAFDFVYSASKAHISALRSTAVGETSFNIDFLANTKNRVGNRVAHEPLLLNRELYRNHNS
jgi:hypothetical protein